jgi:hypothetical protein
MGTDIEGWVEVIHRHAYAKDFWMPLIRIGPLVDRNSGMFNSLFWPSDGTGFRPIAPERGIPADASEHVKSEFATNHSAAPEDIWGPSWITWQEIKAIDWEESTQQGRLWGYHYRKDANGEYRLVSPFSRSADELSRVAEHLSTSTEELLAGWGEGTQREKGDSLYRVEKIRRRHCLEGGLGRGWQTLFRLLEVLEERYGAEGIRLVVWFCS